MEKLVTAAWADAPTSIDVTWDIEEVQRPLAIETIRANVEKSFAASDYAAANKDPESRRKEIDAETMRIVKERSSPRVSRQEIRAEGYLYRMDEWLITKDVSKRDGDHPDRTIANIGNPAANDFTHYEIDYRAKTAKIMGDKQRWVQESVIEYDGLPFAARALFRAFLGKVEVANGQKLMIPDPVQIRAVETRTHPRIAVGTDTEILDGIICVRIQLFIKRVSETRPVLVVVCDSGNFSKPYTYNQYDPTGEGRLVEMRSMRAFDEYGYPRDIAIKRFASDGTLVASEKMAIEKVVLDPKIDKNVFSCRPPDGFVLVDYRLDKTLALTTPELAAGSEVAQNIGAINAPSLGQANRTVASPVIVPAQHNRNGIAYALLIGSIAISFVALVAWGWRRSHR